jgi:hypothetical protein
MYQILVGKPRRSWKTGNRMDLEKRFGRCGLDSCGSGYGPVPSSCEHSNEFLVSVKGVEFLYLLSDYLLLK